MSIKINPDVVDQWSFYDYKEAFQFSSARDFGGWVPEIDQRRLAAYFLLSAYLTNSARLYIGAFDQDNPDRREYGDPETIVDTVMNSLLGDSHSFWVKGAIDESPKEPEAESQLRLLEEWAEKENFPIKLVQNERRAVSLGDAVYVLGWDEKSSRPRLTTYDPGFYFPDLGDDEDEFPPEVHIAYEIDQEENGEDVTYIRRITWRMIDITLLDGDAETTTPRVMPWHEAGDAPANLICFMWDGMMRKEDYDEGDVYTIPDSKFQFSIEALDTDLDFIPVIHVPNSIPEAHFGTSNLARVLQLLDDIGGNDTDLTASARTTGSPALVLHGAGASRDEDGNIITYGPGSVMESDDGATLIDTSKALDALLKREDSLLERLSVNGRIPESLLGRVKPNEVPSGIALTLSFTPHSQMIKEMRLLRNVKYKLLLKFVLRMYCAAGACAKPLPARLVFGSFLPADRSEAATIVNQLYRSDGKPMISLETAVKLLVEAGFNIDDAMEEVRRIEKEDFQSANELLDATGNTAAVADRLGLGGVPIEVEEAVPALPGPSTPPNEL